MNDFLYAGLIGLSVLFEIIGLTLIVLALCYVIRQGRGPR